MTHVNRRAPQAVTQVRQSGGADVAQFDPLQRVPDALIRVQIWRVAGEALQVQAFGRPRAEEVLDGPPMMNGRAVPDDEQLPADLAQQHPQEPHDRCPIVAILTHLQEEASIEGDGADGGEMVTREGHAQDGSLPPRRPGADRKWEQIEARFIYPDDGRSLFVRPFLSAGQRSSPPAAILASSRCVARLIGCWRLQPHARRIRLT
jgi:hypothetical protein